MRNLENYDTVYAEVIEVLNYIPLKEYKKIPQKYITFLEENCDENCEFKYNVALPFEKQNISEKAKDILGMIFRLFIISKEEKEKLTINDKKIEKEKQYDADKIFKKSQINVENETIAKKENLMIVETKNNIFIKIWNRIKGIFKIK